MDVHQPTTDARSTSPRRGRLGRRRAALILAAVAALVLLFHRPMLRAAGRWLIAEEELGAAKLLCLRSTDGTLPDGDFGYDSVLGLMQSRGLERVILLEPRPRRLVVDGLQKSFVERSQLELERRGVPGSAILVIHSRSRTVWDDARGIRGWLSEHPDERVVLFCSPFEGAARRRVLDCVLGPRDAARARVLGVPNARFDTDSWWRSRTGVKHWMFGALDLAYVWLHGEDREIPEPWDPDQYEARLAQHVASAQERTP